MRTRPEILDNATRHTDKNVLVPEFDNKLKLLTLEVLIDIRDILAADIEPTAIINLKYHRDH